MRLRKTADTYMKLHVAEKRTAGPWNSKPQNNECRSFSEVGSPEGAGGNLSYETSFIPTAEVGRASVPADMGRHGGRPYDSVRPEFLFTIKLATLAARGGAEH